MSGASDVAGGEPPPPQDDKQQQQGVPDVWTELFATVAQLSEAVDLSLQAFTPADADKAGQAVHGRRLLAFWLFACWLGGSLCPPALLSIAGAAV